MSTAGRASEPIQGPATGLPPLLASDERARDLAAQSLATADRSTAPIDAELVIDTTTMSAEDAAGRVLELLRCEGYLP